MDVSLTTPDPAAVAQWAGLATRALEPQGHNAPELLAPALRRARGTVLARVADGDGLELALPILRRALPVQCYANLSTPVSFYSLPHLGRHQAIPAVTALLRHLEAPLLLRAVPVEGPAWQAVEQAAGRLRVISRWQRACLRPRGTYDDWFEASFERKRRKEYRRLQSRLAEQGRFEALSLGPDTSAAAWTAEFLTLEAQGWKGRRGTALQADPAAAAMLGQSLPALAAVGKLRFWKLVLDGRPVAMLWAVAEGRSLWLGKIAHDERLARFSPGVLLMLHATHEIFAEGFAFADSCAAPGHPMIDHLWRDRLQVADVIVASESVGAGHFAVAATAERARHAAKRQAKRLVGALTGRKLL